MTISIRGGELEIFMMERELGRMKIMSVQKKAEIEALSQGKTDARKRNDLEFLNAQFTQLNERIKEAENKTTLLKKKRKEFLKKNVIISITSSKDEITNKIINAAEKICRKYKMDLEIAK